MVLFGQIVVGPPGSGKTTYIAAMKDLLSSLGRKVVIVNLDPANEEISSTSSEHKPDVDIRDLIILEEVMSLLKLGPNGGLLYCMEFLNANSEWLIKALQSYDSDTYLMIDCPGQVELYTHDSSVKDVVKKLGSAPLNARLVAVYLADSHYCSDAGKFISVCLTSLNAMLQMELPHINILSKCDLIEKYGKLNFNIDYYTEVLDLEYLVQTMDEDPFVKKYKKLNSALTDLIGNYSLVNYIPLSVKSKSQMLSVKNAADKANGYCFGQQEERNLRAMMSTAMGVTDFEYSKTSTVRENYMGEDTNVSSPEKEKFGNDLDNVDMEPGFQI